MMRPLYQWLFITLSYSLRLFYKRHKSVNMHKKRRMSTIFVINHPSAFMDPLVVADLQKPIVYFLTRSDVFKGIMIPITWMAQMLPIYRQQDNVNTKEMNKQVFGKIFAILRKRYNILIFGEGFTDDVFVRGLKPVKKGAARMALIFANDHDWQLPIHICAVGLNYTSPSLMRSELLISNSNLINVLDYKEKFLANPNKTILELTEKIQQLLKEQITCLENKQDNQFHQQLMQLTLKGMHPTDNDRRLDLESKWRYSKNLATRLNGFTDEEKVEDKKKVLSYFQRLKQYHLDTFFLFELETKGKKIFLRDYALLLIGLPFMLIGFLLNGAQYFFVKWLAEKLFRRRVFWGSVKMMLGKIVLGITHIFTAMLFYHFVIDNIWLTLLYYMTTPLWGLAAYEWFLLLKRTIRRRKGMKAGSRLAALIAGRHKLVEELKEKYEL